VPRRTFGAAAAALVVACLLVPGQALAARQKNQPLQQYVVRGDITAQELARAGYDLTEAGAGGKRGYRIVATQDQAARLAGKGTTVTRLSKGRVSKVARAAQARGPLVDPTHGYDVFRPWSLTPAPCPTTCVTPLEPLKDWYDDEYTANRAFVSKSVFGHSRLGQDLVAYRITAPNGPRNKPVVIFNSTQHAREWISTETNRRLFKYLLDHKSDRDSGIPQLLRRVQVWIVPVVNVDGYDYTFVSADTRFWRKNLRDNDGDGQITVGDGVDTNRNWPEKWRWDPEGASDNPASETYRGPSAASEPEVASYRQLIERLRPKFLLDYHSYGELILYPEGWQVQTENTDDPLLSTLAGRDETHTAIPGYDPDLAAELYTTNGDITDDAQHNFDSESYTVELTPGSGPAVGGTDGTDPAYTPDGFAFQDSEADIQTVFEENLQFALDLIRSARDPDDPVSHIGNEAPDLVPTTFPRGYGDPQTVEVNAKRAVGRVTAHWQVVETGRQGTARTSEWAGGLRYGEPGIYYHKLRADIDTGARAGQNVRVWFTANGARSPSFTYQLAQREHGDVLIMAAEDYKGTNSVPGNPPTPYAGPKYLRAYEEALQAAGVSYNVYDTDAGRTAPSPIGVLSHYKAVIWYTGDDVYTRAPGQPPGTGVAKLLDDEMLATRDYMNDGGKLLVTGQFAMQGIWDQFLFNPLAPTPPNPYCKTSTTTGQNDADDPPGQEENCIAIADDFIQYWLGAFLNIPLNPATGLQEVEPYGTSSFALDPAGNQKNLYSFLTTSSLLPDYPAFNDAEFGGKRALTTANGPAFDPPEGQWYMKSADVNYSYQRLTHTFDLTGLTAGQAADLQFKLSSDTEEGYDFVFVEAHTVGQDDYRTLPDANGNTSDDPANLVGCAEDSTYWLDTHPFLRRYITRTGTPATEDVACNPSSPGIWNAATGNSGGFNDWNIDLSAYAGKQVEVSIVYQTDPGTSGIGVFLDDVRATANGTVITQTGFEDDTLGGWAVTGAPAGSPGNTGDWERSQTLGLVDGPGIATNHSLLWGFGLEGVQGAEARSTILRDALAQWGITS
jgi:hypothetical protein